MQTADPLPADFAAALGRVPLGRLTGPVVYYAEIGSTNDVAATLAAEGNREGSIVIADLQTAGRGRRGHRWFSPQGAGLYVSVVLAPRLATERPDRATALLTLTAGVAIAEGVQDATGLAPTIKWPNDVLVGRRKLAGILAEGVHGHASAAVHSVVLGFGLNVLSAAYPTDLADRVTSLESELGRSVDRAHVCAATLSALATRYDDLLAARYDAILDAWRARAPRARHARVHWDTPGGPQAGTTVGIDDDGALLVKTGRGVERIVSGEVRWE